MSGNKPPHRTTLEPSGLPPLSNGFFPRTPTLTSPPSRPLQNLLSFLVPPNSLHSYKLASLTKLFNTQSNAKTFRVVVGADLDNNGNDGRVRHLIETVLNEDLRFRPYALICPFFTDKTYSNKRLKYLGVYNTEVATSFQRVLFISAIAHVSALLARPNTKKRKTTGAAASSSSASLPAPTKLTDQDPQRIGAAIQRIDSAYTFLAGELGFKHAEQMLGPYLRVTRPSLAITVLSRDQGFANTTSPVMLDADPTLLREETSPQAFDFDPELDSHLRSVASDFVKDITLTIESPSLYGTPANEEWSRMKSFSSTGSRRPTHFETLNTRMMSFLYKEGPPAFAEVYPGGLVVRG